VLRRAPDDADVTLSADGAEAVFVTTHDGRVFVRVARVPSGEALRRFALRTPRPLGMIRAVRRGDDVEVFGDRGGALILDVVRGDVLRWVDLAPVARPRERFEWTFVLDGGRVVWAQLSDKNNRNRMVVVETATGRVLREFEVSYGRRVSGDLEAQMALHLLNSELRFFNSRGAGVRWPAPVRNEAVVGATPHPARPALITLQQTEVTAAPPSLRVIERDGRVTPGRKFYGCTYTTGSVLTAVGADSGVVVDLGREEDDTRRLMWVSARGGELRLEAAQTHKGGVKILGDAALQRAVIASWHDAGIRFERLPEAIEATRVRRDLWWELMQGISSFHDCSCPYRMEPQSHRPREALLRTSAEELPALADRLRRSAGSAQELLDLAYELIYLQARAEADATFRHGAERFPEDWSFYDSLTDSLSLRGAWDLIIALLSPAAQRPNCPQHLLHALGASRLHVGAFKEARETLQRATKQGGSCALADVLTLADLPPTPSPPAERASGG